MTLKPEAALRKDRTTQATMEHRHFAFIAQTIAGIQNKAQRHSMANHFADACAHTNPRFDRKRFLAACLE